MDPATPQYQIKVVSKRTGLSTHVIRAWERRYSVVDPERTETNRRLYTEADVEKLQMLALLTTAGHAIGTLSELTAPQLGEMIEHEGLMMPQVPGRESTTRSAAYNDGAGPLELCLEAIQALNPRTLVRELANARVVFSRPRFLDEVIAPLLLEIGRRWQSGEMRIGHEHMASSIIRTCLMQMLTSASHHPASPAILVSTPSGQQHELGALMAAVRASTIGWRPIYLGADMPAEDIAAAARSTGARALALSLIFPPGDPQILQQVSLIREAVPELVVLIGGQAMQCHRPELQRLGATCLDTLAELEQKLQALQQSS